MLEKTDINQRTTFLRLFIKEVILNSAPKASSFIREEKANVQNSPPKNIEISRLAAPEFTIGETQEAVYETSIKKEAPQIPTSDRRMHPLEKRMLKPKETLQVKRPSLIPFKKKFTAPIKTNENIPHLPSPKPTSGQEIDIGRLNPLITDQEITIIECPGPDKFVLVKKSGKINLTKIKLSKSEINKIISNFSEKARIPLLEGVFRAIVGDLTISAVIAESIGTRFLIYKKSPYSILD